MIDISKYIPIHMDYEGQKLAERIFQTVILIFAGAGLVRGYMIEQFSFTVATLIIGFIIASVLTLPPWPWYRKHSLKWQKPRSTEVASGQKKKK
ncbi:Signal peptidase complex subunit 1 [Halotydeus destructor]|nr:Signal peptidase complex subunit 1 [Halotydeus destructor]